MTALRPVRGTHDLLGDELRRHRRVAEAGGDVARRHGYGEIATPIFEFTEVFARGLGDTTDVVSKEMYTFDDRGGDSLTLRPENTAGVVRALVTGGLTQSLPQKLFYHGPMFRYERPQKGRLRQFHQIGVECVGAAEPEADAEVIAMGARLLAELGLPADAVTLELNSLGDPASRAAYREALVGYLAARRGRLSEDSLARLERNPLRVLDSKDPGDREVVAEAPRLDGHLNDASRAFFDRVRELLAAIGVAAVVNPRLVRGLDYYTHTAFEFATGRLGAQGTVLGGGRYDGLMRAMGGPDIPGVGWAAGVERLALLLAEPPAAPAPVALVPVGAAAETEAWALADGLRRAGVAVDLAFRGKVGQRMKRADRLGCGTAVIFGDEELARGAVKVRDLAGGAEAEVPRDGLAARLGGRPPPP